MRDLGIWLAYVGAVCVSLFTESAHACSYPTPTPFEIEADPADDTPPPPPTLQLAKIKRGKSADGQGCDQQASSCDDLGYVLLDVAENGQDVGYVIEVSGRAPGELQGLFENPVEPRLEPGKLRMAWIDGEGEEDLDFELTVWSVDRAGNMSEEPARMQVKSAGSGGCRAGRGVASNGWSAALLAGLLLARARLVRRATARTGRRNAP